MVPGTGFTLVFSSSLSLPPYSICANEGQACASNQTVSQTAPVFFSFGTKHWVSWEQTWVPPGCSFPLLCTYFRMMFRSVGSACWDRGSTSAAAPSSSSGKAVSYRYRVHAAHRSTGACSFSRPSQVAPGWVLPRASFPEEGTNDKRLSEPSKGGSWQLVTLGSPWMK